MLYWDLHDLFEAQKRWELFLIEFLPLCTGVGDDEDKWVGIVISEEVLQYYPHRADPLPPEIVEFTCRRLVKDFLKNRKLNPSKCKKLTIPTNHLVSLFQRWKFQPKRDILDKLKDTHVLTLSRNLPGKNGRCRFAIGFQRYPNCHGNCPKPVPPTEVTSIDEGVRSMISTYGTLGSNLSWGCSRADFPVQENSALQGSAIQSAYSQKGISHRRRHRMKKARLRLFQKTRNRRRDLHCRMVKYLCETSSVVLTGQLSPRVQLTRKTRTLGKKTVKQWLGWSHYEFRKRLTDKAELYGI
jgi:hypothetical protein